MRPAQVSRGAEWSVSELRTLTDVATTPIRLDCKPNPYDCQLINDGNPLTLWRNWEPLSEAAHIDVTFNEPVRLSGVELLCSRGSVSTGFHIEVCPDGEKCQDMPAVTAMRDVNLDRAGEFLAQEFARTGVRYLLIEDPNLNASAAKLTTEGLLRELYADQQCKLFEIIPK